MNNKFFVRMALITMLLLAACSPFTLTKLIPITNGGNTQPAVTATATLIPTITQIILPSPTESPTQTETPIWTTTPTPTPIPTQIPIQLPTPTISPFPVTLPCNLVGFVSDETIPDGTVISAGSYFTKTWRLQNIGACSWTTAYELVFVSGSLLSGPTVVPLPFNVNPGGTVDVSVNLAAPTSSGTYQGNWMLRDANGILFGSGSNASKNFWVRIVVNNTSAFAVTRVATSVKTAKLTGACLVTLTFNANIYTNGAGTVTYHWQRSNGTKSPTGTLTFTETGIQTVSDAWSLKGTGTGTTVSDRIYIDQPNHQLFSPASFHVSCNSPAPTQNSSPGGAPVATPQF